MDDLISREAAIDGLGEEPMVWCDDDDYAQGLNNQWHYDVNALKAVPSAEPERKVGRWIDTGSGQECSVCGEIQYGYDNDRNFCPNCGAKIKEKSDD